MADEFRSYVLPAADNPFAELVASVRFDDVTNGRRGAVLVKPDPAGEVPIVRTTTRYRASAQRFGVIHERLAQDIQRLATLSCNLNNALVEHYTNAYATMKRHSDQALDLAAGSSIAIYSCYRDSRAPSRRLVVKAKEPESAAFEVPLAHGSVVAFTVDTNRRFTHTIALSANAPENDWLGITLRTSKTFVRVVDGHAHLSNGARLTIATDEQRRELYQLKRRENDETDFTYPPLSYTLSESDLRPPS
ncbi:MAG: alpha-ketoglutarate-dependent dioxygenase AlkB [Kofleriaceae bacterium]